jgi:hypothetical protein
MRMRGLTLAGASVVMAILALVLVAAGSATLGQDLSSPPPTPAETFAAIRGWPGARSGNNPAGLYSWFPGGRRWMHNVGGVEITFDTLDEPYDLPVETVAVAGADLGGPYPAVPERVADVRLQAWRLDVGDSRVVVVVKSFPHTPPSLVAEAEAVVESIRVEPADNILGYRLVFELPGGWDSG